MHIGRRLYNIILRRMKMMKRLTRNSLKWMRPIKPFRINSKKRTMTTLCSEQSNQSKPTTYSMTSSRIDFGILISLKNSDQSFIQNGQEISTGLCLMRIVKYPMREKLLRHQKYGTIIMDNKLKKLWLLRNNSKMEKLKKKLLKSTVSPMDRRLLLKLLWRMVRLIARNMLLRKERNFRRS